MKHAVTIPCKGTDKAARARRRVVWLGGVMGLWAALAWPGTAAQAPAESPAPQPSAAVQRWLNEVEQLMKAKQPPEALVAADRALAAAREAQDPVGEAQAPRARAQVLQHLGRTAEAIAGWREAAAAWARAGDGPGRIEALAEAGLL